MRKQLKANLAALSMSAFLAGTSLLFAGSAHAATLQITAGKLTGATGVLVDGASYDVTFADGTCIELFAGCDNEDFAFQTLTGANAAANALLDQVFLDGVSGSFDTNPISTAVCNLNFNCFFIVPFARLAGDGVDAVRAENWALELNDKTLALQTTTTFDTRQSSLSNYAVFTRSIAAPVPEPSSWMLFIGAFGLVGGAMRRLRRPLRATIA
ncbi:MAG TPA: PEPxxWA-CTERM sorting domain-containing protein [Qipengyuania sp.]|nr:PEPxxWA-CTERM sorting domain-containing protein [Qipengyuania sp.]